MSSTSSLISLAVGLVVGNVFGVYLAQTYELPDLQNVFQNMISEAKKREKSPTNNDKTDGGDDGDEIGK